MVVRRWVSTTRSYWWRLDFELHRCGRCFVVWTMLVFIGWFLVMSWYGWWCSMDGGVPSEKSWFPLCFFILPALSLLFLPSNWFFFSSFLLDWIFCCASLCRPKCFLILSFCFSLFLLLNCSPSTLLCSMVALIYRGCVGGFWRWRLDEIDME